VTDLIQVVQADSEPEPRRYADDTAEEFEDPTEPPPDSDLPEGRFADRHTSWLDFNDRVLQLAEDPQVPLLERVRFAAIFARNLDEFFMVRVAALQSRLAAGITTRSTTGQTTRERLDSLSATAHQMAERHAALFVEHLRPELQEQGVHLLRWDDLAKPERKRVRAVFADRILPVLTPLAVDPAHPFPYISGLSLNLAVVVRDEETGGEHFARVKVPPLLPRYLSTDAEHTRFIAIEDVITAQLPELFPGLKVQESWAFRVTRNEDLEVDDDADNVLQAIERGLSQRRFGNPVRLEVQADASERVLALLMPELGITEREVYRLTGPLDLAALWMIADLDRPELRYPELVPETPPALKGGDGNPDIFAAMRRGDVLVHHPYDSFATTVQALIEQAAGDPATQAIKLTLYRTSGDSPIVDALVDAARAGKQVLVVVEIKARFDEKANIRWARKLEQAGCHVVYGLVGLKTHCKIALVVRSEQGSVLRRYVHVGTGNYHHKTARVYEDFGLLTANPAIGADVADLFNHLSGYTKHSRYSTLLVAPDSLREGLTTLIRREAENAARGRPAGIRLKLNSLVDLELIDELYRASRAGVPIDLLVRGMCALRPQTPGLSETIRVRSILGRFLEHSRIYRFTNEGDYIHLIGSADMMERNLDRRVEALLRVTDPDSRGRLDDALDLGFNEDIDCWELRPDGSWRRRSHKGPALDYQQLLARRHHSIPDPIG
jgi:polyphosphate kinase